LYAAMPPLTPSTIFLPARLIMIFPVGFHQKADILSQSAMSRAFAGASLCEASRRSENRASLRGWRYATIWALTEGKAWKRWNV
jgi:hypothetical protein